MPQCYFKEHIDYDTMSQSCVDRESCRFHRGAGLVIDNVIGYLWDGVSIFDMAMSLFPLCARSSLQSGGDK